MVVYMCVCCVCCVGRVLVVVLVVLCLPALFVFVSCFVLVGVFGLCGCHVCLLWCWFDVWFVL